LPFFVADFVCDAVRDRVEVFVEVTVFVPVFEAVFDAVGDFVLVTELVGVFVEVWVAVRERVGVGAALCVREPDGVADAGDFELVGERDSAVVSVPVIDCDMLRVGVCVGSAVLDADAELDDVEDGGSDRDGVGVRV